MTSTYDASGKLVGCTEQELTAIVSTQLYTVIALGAGLYAYKTFTAENWFDIAVEIGWGCVCIFTQIKRFTTRCVLPVAHGAFSFLKEQVVSFIGMPDSSGCSGVEMDDGHCYVRVIKNGFEMQGHSCIHGLVEHLLEHVEDAESDDVVDVDLNDVANNDEAKQENQSVDGNVEPNQNERTNADGANGENDAKCENDGVDDEEEDGDDEQHDSGDEADYQEKICKIKNHTMKFDFVLCQVPTAETATSENPLCMHTVKYDGFPIDVDGTCFYERKFVPVSHRMMEIVLHYGESEYEINLSSPDNFYVLGNKVLEPAFLKWFVRKNHGVSLELKGVADDATLNACNYTIKCIDNNANLLTLQPCNYLRVCENGFEVHDSGLV
jgi:hypothetical protein